MKFQPATLQDALSVDQILVDLRNCRDRAKAAKCPKLVARIRLAISSAKGAQRHVWNRRGRCLPCLLVTPQPNPQPMR